MIKKQIKKVNISGWIDATDYMLRKGSKVKLKPGSRFYGKTENPPSDVVGALIGDGFISGRGNRWYRVKWDNGMGNTYQSEDLLVYG